MKILIINKQKLKMSWEKNYMLIHKSRNLSRLHHFSQYKHICQVPSDDTENIESIHLHGTSCQRFQCNINILHHRNNFICAITNVFVIFFFKTPFLSSTLVLFLSTLISFIDTCFFYRYLFLS